MSRISTVFQPRPLHPMRRCGVFDAWIAVACIVFGCAAPQAASAHDGGFGHGGGMGHDGFGHGGGMGHGGFDHGHPGAGHGHPGHFPHHGGHGVHGGVIVVPPVLGVYTPGYAYPYSYPWVGVAPSTPMSFPQQDQNGVITDYWYYCADPPGYYPFLQSCFSGWQAVPAAPAD
jgi:hypothetical protein